MRTRRTELLLIGLTVLALCAGLVAGLLAARLPWLGAGRAGPAHTGERSPLAEELELTPDQAEQMRGIWEGVRGEIHQTFDDAQRLQKQRDDALVALLDDGQKQRFQKISQDYADRFTELTKKRERTFDGAVERTRKLLNETQRRKYEQILKTHVASGRDRAGELDSPQPPLTTQPAG